MRKWISLSLSLSLSLWSEGGDEGLFMQGEEAVRIDTSSLIHQQQQQRQTSCLEQEGTNQEQCCTGTTPMPSLSETHAIILVDLFNVE
jgi:hypothetical protein